MLEFHFAARSNSASFALISIALITFAVLPANASILWDWNYAGSGITASGTLTTLDTPDGAGGYLITAITGTRNAETITGLQPTGTAIPGNEPFAVDNLVFAGAGPQLTSHGFGFSTSGGNYSNPFYADFLPAPGYFEFFSKPPFTTGAPGSEDSELPVQFSAAPVVIPEPASYAPVFGGLAFFALRCVRLRLRKANALCCGVVLLCGLLSAQQTQPAKPCTAEGFSGGFSHGCPQKQFANPSDISAMMAATFTYDRAKVSKLNFKVSVMRSLDVKPK